MKIACDIGCGTALPEDEMWRITQRPDEPVETVTERTFSGASTTYQVAGPGHQMICPDCWDAALGFLWALRGVRERKRATA